MASRKYGLLVGCNYTDTPYELKGCINDVKSIHELLTNNERFQFEEGNIKLLTDEAGSEKMPTGENIKAVLKELFTCAEGGDLVFLFFSGHGTIIKAKESKSRKDEPAIVPNDYNLITSIDLRKLDIEASKRGVTFVFMCDSSYSAKLIDKGKEQICPNRDPNDRKLVGDHQSQRTAVASNNTHHKGIPFEVILQDLTTWSSSNTANSVFAENFGSEASLMFQRKNFLNALPGSDHDYNDQRILLSGCQADEFRFETDVGRWYHGLFTMAVLDVLKNNPDPITNLQLVQKAVEFIRTYTDLQHPCLYCSDDSAKTFFLRQEL